MKLSFKYSFLYIVLFISFVSVNQWSKIPIGNLWLEWGLKILLVCAIIKYKRYIYPFKNGYTLLNIYLIWTSICILRGLFMADNYYEYRNLIDNGIPLLIPLLLWLFCRPDLTQYIFRGWYKWGMLAFWMFFLWVAGPTQFYLSPLLLLFCFFPLFDKRKAVLIVLLGIAYSLIDAEDGRSQFIKGVLALLTGVAIMYADRIGKKVVRWGHIMGYFSTILLFTIVLSDATGLIFGQISGDDAIYNNKNRESIDKDTRSLIYYDVYKSSVNQNYWLWGHTPARGNTIGVSAILYERGYAFNTHFNKNERPRNEMLHANVFTWEGLIGLILYALLYMRASYLAVFKSNNKYLPILGCYVAFRWSFGWIEDTNRFLISDISLWVMIAMCYSPLFRKMTNIELRNWARGLIS